MEKWRELEFHYADRLRTSGAAERRQLYSEAYSAVSKLAALRFASDNPEDRREGTSSRLIQLLSRVVSETDRVLEVGCGRGYTCLKMAPHVRSMVGMDVSEPALIECAEVLSRYGIKNVEVKQGSAFDLVDLFHESEFDACLSVDLLEHLHPDDAREHLRQVFHVLKPGGKCILITPSRLTGPHDITKEEFPDAREARGFHLNESTYREMTQVLASLGFTRIRALFATLTHRREVRPLLLPMPLFAASEMLCERVPALLRLKAFKMVISIRLVAHKPE